MDKCRCRTILYAGKGQMNQTNEFFSRRIFSGGARWVMILRDTHENNILEILEQIPWTNVVVVLTCMLEKVI